MRLTVSDDETRLTRDSRPLVASTPRPLLCKFNTGYFLHNIHSTKNCRTNAVVHETVNIHLKRHTLYFSVNQ